MLTLCKRDLKNILTLGAEEVSDCNCCGFCLSQTILNKITVFIRFDLEILLNTILLYTVNYTTPFANFAVETSQLSLHELGHRFLIHNLQTRNQKPEVLFVQTKIFLG